MQHRKPPKSEIAARRQIQALFGGKKRKRGKIRPPKYPKRLQMEFEKELLLLIAPINAYARGELLQALRGVGGIRQDSISDDLDRIFAAYRAFVARQIEASKVNGILARMAAKVSAFNFKEVNDKVVRSVGIDIFTDAGAQEQLGLFASRGAKLITSLADESVKRVEQSVFAGASRGARFEDVADEIKAATGVSDSKARFLARDQTAKLNGELTEARQRSVGIEKYEWSTSLDERVRDSHAANEGKIFSWDSPPETGHPGEDYNCRCVAIPVFEDEG